MEKQGSTLASVKEALWEKRRAEKEAQMKQTEASDKPNGFQKTPQQTETVSTVKQRLQTFYELYDNLEGIFDSLPETIPPFIKNNLKKAIFEDPELKELVEGIRQERPPRFVLVGRTGVGKSSLINALLGFYGAEVSDVSIGTWGTKRFEYKKEGKTCISIIDSRGIGESLKNETAAETVLSQELDEFTPDVVLFLVRCKSRDHINQDARFVKEVCEAYEEKNKLKLPVLVVLNQADEMEPSQYKAVDSYPARKKENIAKAVEQVGHIIQEQGLGVKNIIAVSSLIDWGKSDDELKKLSDQERNALIPEFDGRYQINRLMEELENAIEDAHARLGLITAGRIQEVVVRVANKITVIFCGISSLVATTPIPVSDIFILIGLQGILVVFIAALSGRKIDMKTAGEFVVSMGGVGGLGFGLRLVAQQASKLLNIFPGAGSMVSSSIAAAGTGLIGKAAIKYYVLGMTLNKVSGEYQEEKQTPEIETAFSDPIAETAPVPEAAEAPANAVQSNLDALAKDQESGQETPVSVESADTQEPEPVEVSTEVIPEPVELEPSVQPEPVETEVSESVFCQNCGKEMKPGAQFCTDCGTELRKRVNS